MQTDGRRDGATPRLSYTAEQLNSILASPVIPRRAHILRSSGTAPEQGFGHRSSSSGPELIMESSPRSQHAMMPHDASHTGITVEPR